MKIFSSILGCLILGLTSTGQPGERHIADSLFNVLAKIKPNIERIKILNRLAQFYIFKPGENQIDFDSASAYLSEARRLNQATKSASLNGQLLLTESIMLREKGQKNESKKKVQQAINVLLTSSDKSCLGQAYSELAGYYEYSDSLQLAQRISLMDSAISNFQQSGDTERLGASFHMLGDLYQIKDDYSNALRYLGLALETYKSINHTAVQGIYALMGNIYASQGVDKQALNYGLLALKTAEDVRDTSMQICQISNSIGRTLQQLGEPQKAIYYLEKAIAVAKKYNDLVALYIISGNLVTSLRALGETKKALSVLKSLSADYKQPDNVYVDFVLSKNYINVYTALKQYSNAQPYCDHLLKLFKSQNMVQFDRVDVLTIIIGFYIASGQYDLALKYLSQHRELSLNPENIAFRASNERLWFELDTARHLYGSSVKHLLNFNRLKDTLFNETKARQFQQLEVEFGTLKKEDSLKQQAQHISLLLQRNNLQQTNLKQSKLIRNITIAGSIVLLIFLLLLYHQFRKNQGSSKVIMQKNEQLKDMLDEKEWWLKEVHHRVKNNLHTIICLLESQAMYLEKDALQAVEKSQHRIYAMSMIHQKLYQNEDVKSIDMSVYLDEFIQYLKDSFDVDGIEFITKVEPIELNLTQAVPVGLIINEVVTNSIKYAFTDRVGARILVSMSEVDGMVDLIIADNGKGFIPNEDAETRSLGMQLIKGLSKEIRGSLSIIADDGTKVAIRFKKEIISLTEQIMHKELANYEA